MIVSTGCVALVLVRAAPDATIALEERRLTACEVGQAGIVLEPVVLGYGAAVPGAERSQRAVVLPQLALISGRGG
jgi:hypothetical protein